MDNRCTALDYAMGGPRIHDVRKSFGVGRGGESITPGKNEVNHSCPAYMKKSSVDTLCQISDISQIGGNPQADKAIVRAKHRAGTHV